MEDTEVPEAAIEKASATDAIDTLTTSNADVNSLQNTEAAASAAGAAVSPTTAGWGAVKPAMKPTPLDSSAATTYNRISANEAATSGNGSSASAANSPSNSTAFSTNQFAKGDKVIVVGELDIDELDNDDDSDNDDDVELNNQAQKSLLRPLRDAIVTQISYHSVKRVKTAIYKVQFTGASRAMGIASIGAEQMMQPTPELLLEKEQYEKRIADEAIAKENAAAATSFEGTNDLTMTNDSSSTTATSSSSKVKHPPYITLVKDAIHLLRDPSGSSTIAICKAIENGQYGHTLSIAKLKSNVNAALRTCLAKGAITRIKGSYKLTQSELKNMGFENDKRKSVKAGDEEISNDYRDYLDGTRFPIEDTLLPQVDELLQQAVSTDNTALSIMNSVYTTGGKRINSALKTNSNTRIQGDRLEYIYTLRNSFAIHDTAVGDLLSIWEFLRTFGHVIGIQSPTLRELHDAIVTMGKTTTIIDNNNNHEDTGTKAHQHDHAAAKDESNEKTHDESTNVDDDTDMVIDNSNDTMSINNVTKTDNTSSVVEDIKTDTSECTNTVNTTSTASNSTSNTSTNDNVTVVPCITSIAARSLLSSIHIALLRSVLGRDINGSPNRHIIKSFEMLVGVRDILGDLLNAATWHEVLRQFIGSLQRYHGALNNRQQPLQQIHPQKSTVTSSNVTPVKSEAQFDHTNVINTIKQQEAGVIQVFSPLDAYANSNNHHNNQHNDNSSNDVNDDMNDDDDDDAGMQLPDASIDGDTNETMHDTISNSIGLSALHSLDTDELGLAIDAFDETGDYWSLQPKHALAITKILVNEALESPSVKGRIEDYIDRQAQLATAVRKAESDVKALSSSNRGSKNANKSNTKDNRREISAGNEVVRKAKDALVRDSKKFCMRREPIGRDREYNRYWTFPTDTSHIHIERVDNSNYNSYSAWSQITQQTELTTLNESLDTRGTRECYLEKSLSAINDKLMSGLLRPISHTATSTHDIHQQQTEKEDTAATAAATAANADADADADIEQQQADDMNDNNVNDADDSFNYAAYEEPRRSSRIRYTVLPANPTTGHTNSSKDRSSQNDKTIDDSGRDASVSYNRYQPLSYPWSHASLNTCSGDSNAILTHIKNELQALEDQSASYGACVRLSYGDVYDSNTNTNDVNDANTTIDDNDSRLKWKARVRQATTPNALVPSVLSLENALWRLQHKSGAVDTNQLQQTIPSSKYTIAWHTMVCDENDTSVNEYETPYEWGIDALASSSTKTSNSNDTKKPTDNEDNNNDDASSMTDDTPAQGASDNTTSTSTSKQTVPTDTNTSSQSVSNTSFISPLLQLNDISIVSSTTNSTNGTSTTMTTMTSMSYGSRLSNNNNADGTISNDTSSKAKANNASGIKDDVNDDNNSDNDVNDANDQDNDLIEYVSADVLWVQQREDIAIGTLKSQLHGCLSPIPADRAAWIESTKVAKTLSEVSISIYALTNKAQRLITQLQSQDTDDSTMNSNSKDYSELGGGASNRKLYINSKPTGEVVWSRLSGFPWWPSLVVKPDADIFEKALKDSGDLLVVFMGENDTYRVNNRFMRPFIGGSKDALVARTSKGNKNLQEAVRMATKALLISKQAYGDKDPNAPSNRPTRMDPVTIATNGARQTRSTATSVQQATNNARLAAVGGLNVSNSNNINSGSGILGSSNSTTTMSRPPPRDRSIPAIGHKSSKKAKAAAEQLQRQQEAEYNAIRLKQQQERKAATAAAAAAARSSSTAVAASTSGRQSGRKRKLTEAAQQAVAGGYYSQSNDR